MNMRAHAPADTDMHERLHVPHSLFSRGVDILYP